MHLSLDYLVDCLAVCAGMGTITRNFIISKENGNQANAMGLPNAFVHTVHSVDVEV